MKQYERWTITAMTLNGGWWSIRKNNVGSKSVWDIWHFYKKPGQKRYATYNSLSEAKKAVCELTNNKTSKEWFVSELRLLNWTIENFSTWWVYSGAVTSGNHHGSFSSLINAKRFVEKRIIEERSDDALSEILLRL